MSCNLVDIEKSAASTFEIREGQIRNNRPKKQKAETCSKRMSTISINWAIQMTECITGRWQGNFKNLKWILLTLT